MAMVISLYLYDSSLLLYSNEGVISPSGSRDWCLNFGFRYHISGKELFLPNPFLPHRPIFRLAWRKPCISATVDTEWASRRSHFSPLAPMILALAFTLFVLFPIGLFSKIGDIGLLSIIGLLYLNVATPLVWLGFNRKTFGMSAKRYSSIVLECILCPPFAVNLVRKISTSIPISDELITTARDLQSADGWKLSRHELIRRLNEEIESEDENSNRASSLHACLENILKE